MQAFILFKMLLIGICLCRELLKQTKRIKQKSKTRFQLNRFVFKFQLQDLVFPGLSRTWWMFFRSPFYMISWYHYTLHSTNTYKASVKNSWKTIKLQPVLLLQRFCYEWFHLHNYTVQLQPLASKLCSFETIVVIISVVYRCIKYFKSLPVCTEVL